MANEPIMSAVTLVVLMISTCALTQTKACPQSCYCLHPMVDCYDRSLSEIPEDIVTTAEHVNLNNNNIKSINPEHLSRLINVENLLLANNQLTVLSTGALVNITSLKQLDLSFNFITEIQPDAFQDLGNLQILQLKNNQLETIDGLLDRLTTLERLDLSSNKLTSVTDTTFTGLESLTYLSLANNDISSISKLAFVNMTQMTYMFLSGNPLQTLDGIWEGVPNLSTLDLSSCQLTSVPPGLPRNLRFLRLNNNSLSLINADDLSQTRFLGSIYLDHNQIVKIDDDAFSRTPYLTQISISDNRLRMLPSPIPANVTNFVADNNNIQRVFQFNFDHDSKLNFLSLKNNSIEQLAANTFSRNGDLGSLYLDNNSIQVMYQMTYSRLRQLRVLSLDSNPIREVEKRALGGLSRLVRISLAGITGNVTGVKSNMFRDVPSLTNLNLEGSPYLTASILNDTNILQELRTVKYLNLMNNNMTYLDGSLEGWMPKLRSIRLSGNPWQCDAKLIPLKRWIEKFPYRFKPASQITCQSPDFLKGMAIIKVDIEQFMKTTPTPLSTTTMTDDTKTTNEQDASKMAQYISTSRKTMTSEMTRTSQDTEILPNQSDSQKQNTPNEKNKVTQTSGISSTTIPDTKIETSLPSKPYSNTPSFTPSFKNEYTPSEIDTTTDEKLSTKINIHQDKTTNGQFTANSEKTNEDYKHKQTTVKQNQSKRTQYWQTSVTIPKLSTEDKNNGNTFTDRSSYVTISQKARANHLQETTINKIVSDTTLSPTVKSGQSRLESSSTSSPINGKMKMIIIAASAAVVCLIVGILIVVLIIRYRHRQKSLPRDNMDYFPPQHPDDQSDTVFMINHIHGADTQSQSSTLPRGKPRESQQNRTNGKQRYESQSSTNSMSDDFGMDFFMGQSFDDSEMLIFSSNGHNQ